VPWEVASDRDDCDGFAVVAKDDGSVVACHDDEESAGAQVRALYANTDEEFASNLDRLPRGSYRGGTAGRVRQATSTARSIGARGGGATRGGGGGRKHRFTAEDWAWLEEMEKITLTLAEAVFPVEEFARRNSGQGGGGGKGGSWGGNSPHGEKNHGGINTRDLISNWVANDVKAVTKATGTSTIRAGKRRPTRSTSGRSGFGVETLLEVLEDNARDGDRNAHLTYEAVKWASDAPWEAFIDEARKMQVLAGDVTASPTRREQADVILAAYGTVLELAAPFVESKVERKGGKFAPKGQGGDEAKAMQDKQDAENAAEMSPEEAMMKAVAPPETPPASPSVTPAQEAKLDEIVQGWMAEVMSPRPGDDPEAIKLGAQAAQWAATAVKMGGPFRDKVANERDKMMAVVNDKESSETQRSTAALIADAYEEVMRISDEHYGEDPKEELALEFEQERDEDGRFAGGGGGGGGGGGVDLGKPVSDYVAERDAAGERANSATATSGDPKEMTSESIRAELREIGNVRDVGERGEALQKENQLRVSAANDEVGKLMPKGQTYTSASTKFPVGKIPKLSNEGLKSLHSSAKGMYNRHNVGRAQENQARARLEAAEKEMTSRGMELPGRGMVNIPQGH